MNVSTADAARNQNVACEAALVDPRETFLGRASARHVLYGAGTITLEDAFGGLVEPFKEIVEDMFAGCDVCGDAPCTSPGFCATCRAVDRRHGRRRAR